MAYTNSPLVSKSILSRNCYNGRNGITGVTVHCFVGYASLEDAAGWFNRSGGNASANYYIDKYGKILLNVEEKNGAWTSSSYNNDMNKITIECACNPKSPYDFTDATYNALVRLVADIYKRNGIKKATWTGSTSGNITAHYFFKNKECPGAFFKEKLNSGKFCNEVNAILEGKQETTPKQPESNPVNDFGIQYTAHVQKKGYLPTVRDGQIAGTTGEGLRLEELTIKCPEGMHVTAKAHIQGIGWKKYDSAREIIIGTHGEGRRLEAIELFFDGIPEGKRVYYQVHAQSLGWMAKTENGYPTGTMNQSKRLEAIRIWCE